MMQNIERGYVYVLCYKVCIAGVVVNVCEDSTPLHEDVQFATVSVQFCLKAV